MAINIPVESSEISLPVVGVAAAEIGVVGELLRSLTTGNAEDAPKAAG
jgi:hypothetical protein